MHSLPRQRHRSRIPTSKNAAVRIPLVICSLLLQQARDIANKLEGEIAECEASLLGRVTRFDRDRLRASLAKAQRYLPTWQQRERALGEERTSALQTIGEKYAVAGDKRLALFELRAQNKENEAKTILRQEAPAENMDWWLDFVEADPSSKKQTDDEPIDPSNILATPDVLLDDGVGLQAYLVLGKGKVAGHRNPSRMPGRGPETGPALMGLGRAMQTFGDLSPQPEGPLVPITGVAPPPPKPRTERELRIADGRVTTEDTPGDQWAPFRMGAKLFLGDVSRLARQYRKLVGLRVRAVADAAAAAAEKEKKEADLAESETDTPSSAQSPSAPDSTPEWTPNDGTWPPVTETTPQWSGFTNWVSRCREADEFFKTTLMNWSVARINQNNAVADALRKWSAPEGFQAPDEPDQSTHYHEETPLWVRDGKELGWETLRKS
jgi:hypothetical protein